MRYRGIALFALIALGVSACTGGSGGSSPSPTPPRSTSPVAKTSSPAPTSTAPSSPTVPTTGPNTRPGEKPPKLPEVALTHSRQGAVNFAMYWVAALDWGYATTNPVLANRMYTKACGACIQLTSIIQRVAKHHEHFVGGRLTATSALLSDDDRHPQATATDVTFDQTHVKVLAASGRSVGSGEAVHGAVYRIFCSWNGSSWKIVDLRQVVAK